jgi:ribosomal-protein-alanine N-acetyltransferase
MALDGKLVRLREEREEDLEMLRDLRNDLATQAWSRSLPPDFTLEMYRRRFAEREFSFDRTDGRFVIELIGTGRMAGYCGFYGVVPRLSAVYGIAVAEEFWGKGIAYEAQELLLNFLFEEMGLRVVRMFTHSGNPAMVGLGEKSGFKLAVRSRESIFKGGELLDNLVLDILREEYYERHPDLTDQLPAL